MSAELRGYVDMWWEAINDFTALLERVPEDQWSAPTDLPGWTVCDVAAHTAHLESLTAGGEHTEIDVGEPPHARGAMGIFTEQGVEARRDHTPDEIINEIRSCSTARHTQLLECTPTEADEPAPGLFGAIGWTQRTLLRNRPLDIYMHEQDVRRAVGQPGNLDSPAARHSADYLLESLGFVVAKRAESPPGTSVVLEVAGHDPVAVLVGDDGRASVVAPPADPTVTIRTDRESFLVLAGGRRKTHDVPIEIEGDAELARRILDRTAVTP